MREEDQNEVGGLQRRWDFPRPFLPRQQVFFIQPGLEPIDGPQAVIDLTDLGFILAGMAKENPIRATMRLPGQDASPRALACGLRYAA
jgi:hypothetical protein